jgi:hypothetical protein
VPPIENRYDRNFASNDIPKLIARWRFLEADRQYHAATAPDSDLEKCALGRHREERAKIVEKLVCTVPESLDDANALLKFSIETLAITLENDAAKSTPIFRMLKNVSKGIVKSEMKLKIDAITKQASGREDARDEFLT